MQDSFLNYGFWLSQRSVWASPGTAKCPEPLCPPQALPLAARCPASRQRALPLLPRSYGLMRQTIILLPTSVSLFRPVFAGCCQPLLEDGPSRRYLRNLCRGAWTHTPPRSCRSRPFGHPSIRPGTSTAGHRPHPSLDGFGTRVFPAMQLPQGGSFRGCSHSLMFRLLDSLGPPVAPTAVPSTGQPDRLHHAMNMWLPALITQGFT